MSNNCRLKIHGVHIKYTTKNIFGWFIGKLIQLIEWKTYCHVYPELQWEGHGKSISWNIFGWFSTWNSLSIDILTSAYNESNSWDVNLTKDEMFSLAQKWKSMTGRHYAVGRLFLLPVYRLVKLKSLTYPPGITCAAAIAIGLNEIGLWHHSIPPEMAGLREVENVLIGLKDRVISE